MLAFDPPENYSQEKIAQVIVQIESRNGRWSRGGNSLGNKAKSHFSLESISRVASGCVPGFHKMRHSCGSLFAG